MRSNNSLGRVSPLSLASRKPPREFFISAILDIKVPCDSLSHARAVFIDLRLQILIIGSRLSTESNEICRYKNIYHLSSTALSLLFHFISRDTGEIIMTVIIATFAAISTRKSNQPFCNSRKLIGMLIGILRRKTHYI